MLPYRALQCPSCPLKALGTVASNLSQIMPMKTLNLQQQQLGGNLPPEFGLNGSFPNLINLLLQQNQFTGTVPASWGSKDSFPNLSLLTLSGNNLTGPLPEPQLWPQLHVFRCQHNQFSGTIPGSWAQSMPNAQILALQQNRLRGQLPLEWAPATAFTSLEELYLQNNLLEGRLPRGDATFKLQFPKMRIVDMSFNNFTGDMPASWGENNTSPNLELMYLRNLSLAGTLPPIWGNGGGMDKLRQLWIDGNDLSGTIPAEWASFPSLEQLYVRPGNLKLCGPLPPGITFQLCSANGNSECNETVALDGPTCPPWVPPPPPEPEGGSNTSAIVGGVVGGVAGGILLAAGVVLVLRWNKRRKQRMSPFIAEAQGPVAPSKDDLSKYSRVLESVEGGGDAKHENKLASWPSRVASRMSGMFGSPSQPISQSSGTQLSPLQSGSVGSGAAPAAAAAAGGLATSGKLPSRDGLLTYHNDSVLLSSMDMSAASAAGMQGQPSAFAYNYTGNISSMTLGGGMTPIRVSEDVRGSVDAALWGVGIQQLPDWEIQPEEIQYMKRADGTDWELGCGGFGKVFKAMRNGAQPVAVKVLTSGPDTRYMAMAEFKREVAILKSCRDPNIVAFLGACLRDDCAMLVTEYCEGGNLARNILAHKVSWYRRGRKIAIDIAKGLVFLHSRRIVHLDLKSPNILLARDGTAKIADVGLAKIIAQEYSAVTGAVGTLAWSSPEMLLGARCTERSDIYSYGVVLWEIATGQTPIRGQLRDVRVPEECPEELRKLMLDCLEQNPRRRPSATQIIDRLKKIPVSPEEHQPALPPATLRPETAAEARASAGRRKRAAGASGAPTPAASASASPISAFAAAAGGPPGTPMARTASNASDAGRQAGAPQPQRGGSPAPVAPAQGTFAGAPLAPAGSLPTPFGAAARRPSSATEGQLPAWGSEEDLASSSANPTEDAGTEPEGASRSLSLSRDPSLVAPPGRTASGALARAGSGLPPRPSPFASSKLAAHTPPSPSPQALPGHCRRSWLH